MEGFCACNCSLETTVRFLVVGINGSASKPFTNVMNLQGAHMCVMPYLADLLMAGLPKDSQPNNLFYRRLAAVGLSACQSR